MVSCTNCFETLRYKCINYVFQLNYPLTLDLLKFLNLNKQWVYWLWLTSDEFICSFHRAIVLCMDHYCMDHRLSQFDYMNDLYCWIHCILNLLYLIGDHCYGKSLMSIEFVDWVMDWSCVVWLVVCFPNYVHIMLHRSCIMINVMVHLWWSCLCVTFLKDVASSALLWELY